MSVDPSDPHELAHREDHATSKAGARSVALRSSSQKARLLVTYLTGPKTAYEAALAADLLQSCYWHRCGDLLKDGLIEAVVNHHHQILTRPGPAGDPQRVCRLTLEGWKRAKELAR